MRTRVVILTVMLLGATAVQPALAAGLLGLSSSGGGAGVSGVATATANSSSGGTTVDGTVLGGGGGTINAGLGSVIGGNSNIGVTLPGTTTSGNELGDTTDTVNGVTDNGGTVNTLLGDTDLSGDQGGVGGAIGGNGGLLGTDLDGSAAGGTSAGGTDGAGFSSRGTGAANLIAGAGSNSAACRRDAATLSQLLGASYSAKASGRWSHASGVQVVKVPVCAQIRGALGRALEGNPNMGRLQQMAEADSLISTSVTRSGASLHHVLGVGQGANGLTVYVY